MRKNYIIAIGVLLMSFSFSCTDKWDEHYAPKETVVSSDFVEVADVTAKEYIESTTDLSSIANLFEEQGVFDELDSKDQRFTVLVYSNSTMASATYSDPSFFAETCVCDVAFTPTKLIDGLSIQMWNGKYLTVNVVEGDTDTQYYIAESQIESIVQVNDGYVYVMKSPIYAPKSLYEMLNELGDDYSLFKEMVLSYEEKEFDKDNSVPTGVDETGNTVYDSVFVTKNTLMDRYTSGGSDYWNMRSEYFNSTMLIPNNELITNAMDNAYDYVRDALSREPTESDSTKFEQFIIESAFYDYVLTPEELDGDEDLYSVSGYIEDESTATDGKQWKPSVQKVDTSNPVTLSNGVAYYTTSLKIPNNVVIWRIKNRFYYWDYCSETEKEEYFKWDGLENISINDNGGFGPLGEWPYVAYKCVRAWPTEEAKANFSPVSVECTGISLQEDGTVAVVMVPPGEYHLRMGFQSNKYPYLVNIYFNGELVSEGLNPNIHYDRTGLGYPEGYVWQDWYATSSKAAYYDCDGAEIAVVTVTGTELQPIKIKIESTDIAEIGASGNSKARYQLYCWTLRPTENNY